MNHAHYEEFHALFMVLLLLPYALKQSENEVRLPAAHDLSWWLVECPNPLGLLRYSESKPHHATWLMPNIIAY